MPSRRSSFRKTVATQLKCGNQVTAEPAMHGIVCMLAGFHGRRLCIPPEARSGRRRSSVFWATPQAQQSAQSLFLPNRVNCLCGPKTNMELLRRHTCCAFPKIRTPTRWNRTILWTRRRQPNCRRHSTASSMNPVTLTAFDFRQKRARCSTWSVSDGAFVRRSIPSCPSTNRIRAHWAATTIHAVPTATSGSQFRKMANTLSC